MLLKNVDLEGDVNGRQLVNGSRGVVSSQSCTPGVVFNQLIHNYAFLGLESSA
jgi:hypothetical protein